MPLTIEPMQPADHAPVAEFLTALQAEPATHLGFMGVTPAQIIHDFNQYEEATFWLAREDGALVGMLGNDLDSANNRLFIWGPAVNHADWDGVVDALWAKARPTIPAETNRFEVFCNAANLPVQRWAERVGIPPHSNETIMVFVREDLAALGPSQATPLVEADHAAFVELHDTTFPGTYYSGAKILERRNAEREVLTVHVDGTLAGYVYSEVEPATAYSGIEFVGVAPFARGKRLGRELVIGALHWIFSFPEIDEIELVVNGSNAAARALYESVGFKTRYEMVNFRRHGALD